MQKWNTVKHIFFSYEFVLNDWLARPAINYLLFFFRVRYIPEVLIAYKRHDKNTFTSVEKRRWISSLKRVKDESVVGADATFLHQAVRASKEASVSVCAGVWASMASVEMCACVRGLALTLLRVRERDTCCTSSSARDGARVHSRRCTTFPASQEA